MVNKHKLLSVSIWFLPLSHSALTDPTPTERSLRCFLQLCEFCNSLHTNVDARYPEEEARGVESVVQERVWWLLICLESKMQNIQQTVLLEIIWYRQSVRQKKVWKHSILIPGGSPCKQLSARWMWRARMWIRSFVRHKILSRSQPRAHAADSTQPLCRGCVPDPVPAGCSAV